MALLLRSIEPGGAKLLCVLPKIIQIAGPARIVCRRRAGLGLAVEIIEVFPDFDARGRGARRARGRNGGLGLRREQMRERREQDADPGGVCLELAQGKLFS